MMEFRELNVNCVACQLHATRYWEDVSFFLSSTKEVWEAIEQTYLDGDDLSKSK